MNFQPIKIGPNQSLADVCEDLPSKAIIFKTIPGIGATTLEILSDRNSIIVEPFVPVIEGKHEFHKKLRYEKLRPIQPVMDGVSDDAILSYLADDAIPFKKIMVTPESYWRIREILEDLDEGFRSKYFILIDECEKLIQSKHFRKRIDSPLEDFFEYSDQAMVSATPIMPSDKRFEDFNIYKVEPQFDYQRSLKLHATNNVIAALVEILEKGSDEKIFVFSNCLHTISSAIILAEIQDSSMVYCSEKSFSTLREKDIKNFASSFLKASFKKVNFLTSRFFSAVDIHLLGESPNVILATNLYRTPHSIIDPNTEAIQISGRIRTGIGTLTHITNTNGELEPLTRQDLIGKYNNDIIAYKVVRDFLSVSENLNSRSVIGEMLDREFAPILNEDNSINSNKIDNLIEQKLIPSYYNSLEILFKAYSVSGYFNISQSYNHHVQSDRNLVRLETKSGKDRRIELVEQINDHYTTYGQYHFSSNWTKIYMERNELFKQDTLISEAFLYLGYEKIIELNYNVSKLKETLVRAKQKHRKSNFQMLDAILAAFEISKSYTSKEIKERLQEIYIEYGYLLEKATAKDITKYFDVIIKRDMIRNGKKVSGYKIKGFKKLPSKELTSIIAS